MTRSRIRISAKSMRFLAELHEFVVRRNVRGDLTRFRDIASDRFDGHYYRLELDDLISRRLLTVIRHGFDDSLGRDPMRNGDPKLCGFGWSVDPAERLVRTLWPDRITP